MGNTSNQRARRGTLAGTIVDGHELLRVLATGGMGEVYLARHLRLGIQRAIKVIRGNHRADPVVAERFTREAQVLARLQHNSIIQIVEFGELDNGWPFFVMEYVDGPNLDQVVSGLGPVRLTDALVILEQIANALAYAHGVNVIHRDLKPANVLLRGGDARQVKVIDFGLARMVSADAMSRLTADGQMLGSPVYMAPEQAAGQADITPAADTYALAGIAYTLLSGSPVFGYSSGLQLIAAHAGEQPQRLSVRCPQIPQLLDDLLLACLTKEPELRPRADELASHLARLARKASEDAVGNTAVAASARMATMLDTAAGVDSELARVVRHPPKDDGTGIGDALVNQAIAVVSEIAVALSANDSELARMHEELTRSSATVEELELEIVMLEARRDEAVPDRRSELESARNALVDRAAALRQQVRAIQYALATRVDRMRAHADSSTRKLFAEVDGVLQQLRSVGGGSS